tara:strand:+ start:608 stop:1729 length:1122 start_codon:yes stop_codon:yes gene_type:complete
MPSPDDGAIGEDPSPLIKRIDNPMGVSFRMEPLALLDHLRGVDVEVKDVGERWRVRALNAEEALRKERANCGDCHKKRERAEGALKEHKEMLKAERDAKVALTKELKELKERMDSKVKELEKKSEEDQLKAKRALEAAIEAAARASKQSAVEEKRKRDQLEELNEKLRQEIKQLQNANDRANDRIGKLEDELKRSYNVKSDITKTTETNEAFTELEEIKYTLEVENVSLRAAMDEKSGEIDGLKAELKKLREQVQTVTSERDATAKDLRQKTRKFQTDMKRLAKELEKSRQATTDTERRLRETIETHIRENHVFRTKLSQSDESRKRDRQKFEADREHLNAEISRLMRLLSKAEAREEHIRGRKHILEEELQV